ncbi:MAG: radical SAM protein, partial [Clostridia bacterium]|nr:radical SAM protein [Clostridia bacterium]
MKHSNISLFVPHAGCPNQCSFCNQKTISGRVKELTKEEVKRTLEFASNSKLSAENTEIAFFGGSFTAINRDYMISLLEEAKPFIDNGLFSGIRISTRPDSIDEEVLGILKSYKVTAIELGAQSTNDEVLLYNRRGHTKADIINASLLIKKYGFSLGLQMMTGLYKSTRNRDIETA